MSLISEVQSRRRLPPPMAARAIREEAGITQERMAAELGVARMTFGRWEAGQRKPRPATAAAWAELLERLQEVSS